MNTQEEPLFFLLGVARSGTTLVSLMLNAHSQIAIPYESHFIVPYFHQYQGDERFQNDAFRKEIIGLLLEEKYVKQWDREVGLEDINLQKCDSLKGCISQLFMAYAKKNHKRYWADKTPAYINEIHVLHNLFPNARYIHLVRDGRDVALSLSRQFFGPNDLINALRYWERSVDTAQRMLKMIPPNRSLQVRFEDIANDPSREMESISRFLEISFEPEIINAHTKTAKKYVGKYIQQHHEQLQKPISTKNTEKWKRFLSKSEQALAYEIAGRKLDDLGYESGVKKHPLKVFSEARHRVLESINWRFKKKKNNLD